MKYHVPSIGAYQVLVPEGYILEDDGESGLLSVASPNGSSCLTISSYGAEQYPHSSVTEELFEILTQEYEPLSEAKRLVKDDYLVERNFQKEGRYWTWWLLADGKKLLAASVNSEEILDEEMLDLYRFIVMNILVHNDVGT